MEIMTRTEPWSRDRAGNDNDWNGAPGYGKGLRMIMTGMKPRAGRDRGWE
jgi:hypothetical protein